MALIKRERERERSGSLLLSVSLRVCVCVSLSLTIELVGGARERDPDDERYDYFSLDDDDFLLRAVVDFSSSPFISWFKRRVVGRSEEFTFAGIGRW